VFIYGSRLFGKVDAVPGLGHVATKFGHLNYLPLIPLEGWLVMSEGGEGWRGLSIPLSGKSVLVAWARAAFVLVGGFAALGGVIAATGDEAQAATAPLVTAALCIAGMIGSYRWRWLTRASPERALQIAQQAGLDEAAIDRLRRSYDVPAPAAAQPAQPWAPPEA